VARPRGRDRRGEDCRWRHSSDEADPPINEAHLQAEQDLERKQPVAVAHCPQWEDRADRQVEVSSWGARRADRGGCLPAPCRSHGASLVGPWRFTAPPVCGKDASERPQRTLDAGLAARGRTVIALHGERSGEAGTRTDPTRFSNAAQGGELAGRHGPSPSVLEGRWSRLLRHSPVSA
jgi:hypothetical protein